MRLEQPFEHPSRRRWASVCGVLLLTTVAFSCASGPSDRSPSGVPEDVVDEIDPDTVRAFLQEKAQPGSAAFVIPSPIRRDTTVTAVLKVSAVGTTPEQLQRDLEQALGGSTKGVSDRVQLTNRMEAQLTTIERDAAEIEVIGYSSRAVPFDEPTQWEWSVTPIVGGEVRFRALLLVPVAIDGNEAPHMVRSFDEVVTVKVTTAQRFGDAGEWVLDRWVPVAAILAALGSLGVRFRNRRARRGKPPSHEESRAGQ